ncbi:MAG: transglycosylase family protein [Galactobacter sp.]
MKNTKLRRAGIVGGTAALALVAGSALAAAPANASPVSADVWDKVAQCESGGNWSINTGNGYHGGLQFSQQTWNAHGGTGSAANASKAQQKNIAKKVLKSQGPGAWPHCSKAAGLTRSNGGAASAGAATQQAPVQKRATTNYSNQKVQRTAKQTPVQQRTVQQAPVRQQSAAKHVAPAVQAPTVAKTDAKGSGKFVTVKSGDTLGKIADSNNVKNWVDLYSVNADEVSDPNLILVGQKLELPAK